MGKKDCFIICPIGEENSETRIRADKVYKDLIEPVVASYGYKAIRADMMPKPGIITTHIINAIVESPLVIADLTGGNPNVFYELALRHASQKPYIQLIEQGEKIPFDVNGIRTININANDTESINKAKKELSNQTSEIEKGHKVESPVSVALVENLLTSDSNIAQLFLEKFWSIEDDINSIIPTLNGITASIEDIVKENIESAKDDIISQIVSELKV